MFSIKCSQLKEQPGTSGCGRPLKCTRNKKERSFPRTYTYLEDGRLYPFVHDHLVCSCISHSHACSILQLQLTAASWIVGLVAGLTTARRPPFYLRRYDERSRDYQSCCCCCDIFLTFSFCGRF